MNNDINKPTQQNTQDNVNFEFTRLKEDTDQARQEAMTNYVAGAPSTPIILPKNQAPRLDNSQMTTSFTTRDEIMSRLSLIDENFNYTDTYTNYISQGGTPLPGYEQDHQALLNVERQEQFFEQEANGQISHDTALLEAYGQDILQSMGYDVTSVAFWDNKFRSNDFSHPFQNKYLMDQVLASAEEYHQAQQISKYGSSTIQNSQMAGLVGEELASTKIKDLFPNLKEYADEQSMTDADLRKQITSGQIDALARTVQRDANSYYYLHTDGQLYILDNQSGDNHGSFTTDADGKISSISLNNSDIIDVTRHFLSSAASVFTGLGKIVAIATAGVEALVTGENYIETLNDQIADIDSFFNDSETFNWLTDSGHIDTNGFQLNDPSDWMFAVADIVGMVAGGYGLGSAAGVLSKAGTSLATSQSVLARGAGSVLKFTGNLAARSTGMYQGAKGFNNQVFTLFGHQVTTSAWAPMLNHALKTVPTYAIKDFYSTVSALSQQNIQAQLNGEEARISNIDIFKRAATISVMNGLFSAIFAGGINDNQVQRLGLDKKISDRSILDKVSKAIKEKGTSEVQNKLKEILTNSELKKFMTSRKAIIAINTTADLLDNFFTMNAQDALSTVKDDGTLVSLSEAFSGYTTKEGTHKNTFLAKENWIRNAVQAAIMTAPTLKGNLGASEYSIPLQELGAVHNEIIASFDRAIAKTTNADDAEAIKLVKQNYITDYASKDKASVEEKVLYAMDRLANNLGDKDKLPPILSKAMNKVIKDQKAAFYGQLYRESESKRLIHNEAIAETYKNITKTGFVGSVRRMLMEKATGLSSTTAWKTATSGQGYEELNSFNKARAKVESDINDKITPTIKAWENISQTRISNSLVEKLKYNPEDINFDNAQEHIAYEDLKPDAQLEQKIAETLGDNKSDFVYIRIKNEASLGGEGSLSDRMKANLFKTSLDILSKEDNSLYVKIDDNYYAMSKMSSAITQAFTLDATYKYNMALLEIARGNRAQGIDLMLATYMGDYDYENEENMVNAGKAIVELLDVASKNKVIDEIDAVSTLDDLINGTSSNAKTKKALEAFKKNTALTSKNALDYNNLTPLEKKYKMLEAIKEFSSLPNKKLFTSEATRAAKDLLLSNGKPNKDVLEFITAYNAKYGSNINVEDFYNKITQLAKDSGLNPYSSAGLNKLLVQGAALTKDMSDAELENYAREVLGDPTDESRAEYKRIKKEFIELLKESNKLYDKAESKKMDGNTVVLNYAHDFGEETHNVRRKLQVEAEQRDDKELARMNFSNINLNKEFRAKASANTGNKLFEVFDLSDPFSRKAFIAKAELLDIFEDGTDLSSQESIQTALRSSVKNHAIEGVGYSGGLVDVVKLKGVDMDKVAKEIMNIVNTQKPTEYVIDPTTNKAKKIDMINQIKNAIKLENLSPKQIKRFKRAGKLSVLPFLHSDSYEYKSIVDVLFDTNERATKQGTLGGRTRDAFKQSAIESFTAKVEADPELSKYFALVSIMKTISESPQVFEFKVKADYLPRLQEMEVVGENGFYDYMHSGKDVITLMLKPEPQFDRMLKYLNESNKVNMFKIIPMFSSDETLTNNNYYAHPLIKDGKLKLGDEEVSIPNMYFGLSGIHQGVDTLFNIEFGWDLNNKLKNELLFNICKNAMSETFDYDPFTAKPKDAIGDLVKLYDSEMNALLGTKGKDVEDYRPWLKEDRVIEYLGKAYYNGKLDSVTVDDIINLYKGKYKKIVYPEYTLDDLNYNNIYYPRSQATDGMQMSGDLLVRAGGYVFDPYNSKGELYKGADLDIQRAIEEFKNNVDLYTDYQSTLSFDDNMGHIFEESWITKIMQSAGGNNGYFTIEDADYINGITEKEFAAIFDGTSVTTKEAKLLYKGLKDIAKGFITFGNRARNLVTSYKAYADNAKASVEIDDGKVVLNPYSDKYSKDIKTAIDLNRNKQLLRNDYHRTTRAADYSYKALNNMSEDLFNRIVEHREDVVRDKFASPSNLTILDLQDVRNRRAEQQIVSNTVANLQDLSKAINSDARKTGDASKLMKLAMDLYVSAAGTTKFINEYEGYKLINDDMELVDSLTKAKNPLEIYDALNSRDLKGLTFLKLNKHDLLSNDGVTFDYFKLSTDDEVQELKNTFLLEGVESMYNRAKHDYSSKEEYLNWLSAQDNETFKGLLDAQTKYTLSQRKLQDIIATAIHKITPNIEKDEVRKIFVSKIFGSRSYTNEGLNNFIENKKLAANSTDPYIIENYELQEFGITYNGLKPLLKETLAEIEQMYSTKLNIKDEDLNELIQQSLDDASFNKGISALKDKGYSIKDVIKSYIIESKNADAIVYKTNKEMTLDKINNMEDSLLELRTFNNEKINIKDINNIINKTDTSRKLIVFDMEGEIKKAIKNYTTDEIFQIALKVYDGTDSKPTTQTYFILHEENGNIINPKQWIEKNILKDKKFYKDNKAFRQALENYASWDTGGDFNFIKISDLQKMIGENNILMAFNGTNYDFKFMEKIAGNNIMVDAKEISTIMDSGDDIFSKNTQENVINKSGYLKAIGETGSAHDAGNDVEALSSYIEKAIPDVSDTSIKSKQSLLSRIDSIAEIYGIDDAQSLYRDIDKFFKDNMNNNLISRFDQKIIDASDSAQIRRYLNFMIKNDMGYVLNNFSREGVFKQLGIGDVVKDIIVNKKYYNISDNLAYLFTMREKEDPTYTVGNAFRDLINMSYSKLDEDNMFRINALKSMSSKDLLNDTIGEIDYSDPDFIRNKKLIEKNLSSGLIGNQNSKYGLNADDIKEYELRGNLDSYLHNISDLVKDINVDEEVKDYILQRALHPTISTEDFSYDHKQELVIQNEMSKKLQELINDYGSADTLLAFKQDSIYNMISPLNPFGEQYKEIKKANTTKGWKAVNNIKNIDASEIVLTKAAAEYINGGKSVSTLFDENGDAWCYSLAYPSDKQNHLLAHKLRIVEGDEIRIYATPMVMASLRARDFDGDFITVFAASSPEQREIAKLCSKYLFRAHTLQEQLFKTTDSFKGASSTTYIDALRLASDKDILKKSYEIDNLLRKGKDTIELEIELYDLIKEKTTSVDVSTSDEDLYKILGVSKDKGQFKMLTNPILIRTVGSYSHNQYKSWVANNATTKTNLVDSIYGYFKKWKVTDFKGEIEITNPLSQLNSTDIQITGQLVDGINKATLIKDINKLFGITIEYITNMKSELNNKEFSDDMDIITSDISQIAEDINTENNLDVAKALTAEVINSVLGGIESSIRRNEVFNAEVRDIAKNNIDSTWEEDLNHKLKLRELRNMMDTKSPLRKTFREVSSNNEAILLDKVLSDVNAKTGRVYRDNVSNVLKSNRGTVAVLIDDMGAEDTIHINKNTKLRYAKVQNLKMGKQYKINGNLPSKLAEIKSPVRMTASEINSLISGAHFKNDVDVYDIIMSNVKDKPEVLSMRIVEFMPIGNQKVLALGKGVEKLVTPSSKNETYFDALVSKSIIKAEKLSQSEYFNVKDANKKVVYVKEMNSKGKIVDVPKRVYIFNDVPMNLLINDSTYKQGEHKVDYMTMLGSNYELPSLGTMGSIFYENKDGRLIYSDEKIRPIFEDEEGKHVCGYSNGTQIVQVVRTLALGNLMNKYNLWNAKNKDKYISYINSYDQLKNDVMHDMEIASDTRQYKINQLKNFIISNIGKDVFNQEISNSDKMTKTMFSKDIEKYFAIYSQGDLFDFTDTNGEIISLKSKNKARESVKQYATEALNKTTNKANKEVLSSNIRDLETIYIPFDEVYRLCTGKLLNNQDMLEGTAKGILGNRRMVKNNASTDGNFKPVDKDFTVELKDGMTTKSFLNNLKNGAGGELDYQETSTLNGMEYIPTEGPLSLADLEKLPHNLSLYNAIYKNITGTRNSSGYDSTSAFLAYNIYNMFDRRNKNNVDKAIAVSNRMVDPEIAMVLLRNTWGTEDGKTTYSAKPFVTKDTFNNISDNKRDELNLSLNKYNYYSHAEIYNKYEAKDKDVSTKVLKDFKKNNNTQENNQLLKDVLDTVSNSYNKVLSNSKDTYVSKGFNSNIKFTFDSKNTKEVFKNSLWTGSGIKIEGEDTMAINVALKNYGASAEYSKVEATQALAKLNSSLRKVNSKDFQDFCTYNWLCASRQISEDDLKVKAEYTGYKVEELDTSLSVKAREFERKNPAVVTAYNNYVNSIISLVKYTEEIMHEPFGNLNAILAPFKSNDIEINKKNVYNAIKGNLNFNDYDPSIGLKSNMMFNFFDSANSMINQLSKLIGAQEISKTLENQGLIDNTSIVDKVFNFMTDNLDASKVFIKSTDPAYEQANEDILSVISQYSDINVAAIIRTSKTPGEKFQKLYMALSQKAADSKQQLEANIGTKVTLSDVKWGMDNSKDLLLKKMYTDTYNDMWSQIIVGQRILEISPKAMQNATDIVNNLSKDGYALCNKYGQRIAMNTPIRPISESSLKFISDNFELYANSSNPEKFAQYVIEKALSGEIYIAKADLVGQLEDKVYTTKARSKFINKLSKVSKISSSLQMSMPTKILSRITRFTGFDYIMGALYNPNSVKYAPQAAKEIMQAVHTKGKSITPGSDLYEYMIREGQPLGVKGKDTVTFSEDLDSKLSKFTDALSAPLQVQNHLGRYAIYLAAKKSFDTGDPWYGPVYKYKDKIDSLSNNADKAMFVMDYMLGSPGGFPYLSKKTSGLMMYSTFPLNLTRTMGAWGMSIGRLATEGFTSENAKHWMRNLAYPSLGVFGITAISNLLISYICDLYGVDEETEEAWKEQGVTIDPFGTILGDTPSVVYDSVNPLKTLREMYYEPFVNKYNKTATDKFKGLINTNITSRLNPAIKSPIEVIRKKDFFGASDYDTSHQYTYGENAIRKVLGFFIGNGVANNIVNQYKVDKYNEDSNMTSSLYKGISKGISADLGNQKSWKKNTSNYYAAIDSIRDYYNATSDNSFYDADTNDLIDANYLNGQRNQSSKYGEYNADDFKEVNNMIRQMIKGNESPATLYAYIASKYNEGVSEATLRAALNSNSIIRKLSKVDKEKYYNTLSSKELQMLAQAIAYEEEMYPLLQEFFPNNTAKYKTNKYKTYYPNNYGSYGNSNYTTYPKKYYPSFTYPSNNNYYKKYNLYSPYANTKKVQVNVSPEMGVWKNDYNAIKDLPNNVSYINNQFYNNLNYYEKRQKGGN